MSSPKKYYPREENLGKDCMYWCLEALASGCDYPKFELQHRRSCEGIIDDVCLFVGWGREPISLSEVLRLEIKTRIPSFDDKSYLPPGDVV